jgi:hypothetical protein
MSFDMVSSFLYAARPSFQQHVGIKGLPNCDVLLVIIADYYRDVKSVLF